MFDSIFRSAAHDLRPGEFPSNGRLAQGVGEPEGDLNGRTVIHFPALAEPLLHDAKHPARQPDSRRLTAVERQREALEACRARLMQAQRLNADLLDQHGVTAYSRSLDFYRSCKPICLRTAVFSLLAFGGCLATSLADPPKSPYAQRGVVVATALMGLLCFASSLAWNRLREGLPEAQERLDQMQALPAFVEAAEAVRAASDSFLEAQAVLESLQTLVGLGTPAVLVNTIQEYARPWLPATHATAPRRAPALADVAVDIDVD